MADQDDKKNQPSEELPSQGVVEPKIPEEPVELSQDSQNLLKEFDTAGLEVADMPESNELQERRRKTKNRLRELAEVGEPEAENPDGEAFENEEGGLMDLLREANLTKRQVGFCCGGVLVLMILVGLVYGGIKVWSNWASDSVTEETTDENTSDTTPDTTPVSSYPDSSLTAGIMVGQSSEGDTSTGLGQDIGTAASSDDELSQLIVDFSKLYQAMQVDVNQLLDQSTDRAQALADYEQQLNYLLYIGKQNQKKLSDESDSLEEQYSHLEDLKDEQESRFFDKLKNLDGYASSAALDSFVADGQEIVRLRAHYQARQKLLTYYELVISSVTARIEDLQVNEVALIQGVQVTDVEGSDIDLILGGSDL